MRLRRPPAADQTRLAGNKSEMRRISDPLFFWNEIGPRRLLAGRSLGVCRAIGRGLLRLADLARAFLQGICELTCCALAVLSADPELSKGCRIARPEGIEAIGRIQPFDLAQSCLDEGFSDLKTGLLVPRHRSTRDRAVEGSRLLSVATFTRAFVTCA